MPKGSSQLILRRSSPAEALGLKSASRASTRRGTLGSVFHRSYPSSETQDLSPSPGGLFYPKENWRSDRARVGGPPADSTKPQLAVEADDARDFTLCWRRGLGEEPTNSAEERCTLIVTDQLDRQPDHSGAIIATAGCASWYEATNQFRDSPSSNAGSNLVSYCCP
jgi:hypothetical protein